MASQDITCRAGVNKYIDILSFLPVDWTRVLHLYNYITQTFLAYDELQQLKFSVILCYIAYTYFTVLYTLANGSSEISLKVSKIRKNDLQFESMPIPCRSISLLTETNHPNE